MKKITLKQNQGKMAKRNQLILGIILVFVMFFSVIGYSFQGAISEEKTTKLIYNNLFDRIFFQIILLLVQKIRLIILLNYGGIILQFL